MHFHISEIAHKRVEKVEDYIKQGEVFDEGDRQDPKNGKLKFEKRYCLSLNQNLSQNQSKTNRF